MCDHFMGPASTYTIYLVVIHYYLQFVSVNEAADIGWPLNYFTRPIFITKVINYCALWMDHGVSNFWYSMGYSTC